MRVLVTGGAGFIGSHLVDALLRDGHAVAALDDLSSGVRENVAADAEFFQVDIRDHARVHEAVSQFRPDWISHQAAQMSVSRSVREPEFDAAVNVVGLIHVLTAAAAVGVKRVVFASSGGVMYGDVSTPAGEDTPPNPQSPYGISKWAGERYLEFFTREHALSAVALRYANVYGQRQNPHGEAGVVAIFCTRMLLGETYTINGDGRYIRDYVHVSDVVSANLRALSANVNGFLAVNVGTSLGTDVNELAGKLQDLCQRERAARGLLNPVAEPIHGPPRAGDLRSNLLAHEKAARLLGWTPRISMNAGLSQTAAWFAGNLLAGCP